MEDILGWTPAFLSLQRNSNNPDELGTTKQNERVGMGWRGSEVGAGSIEGRSG